MFYICILTAVTSMRREMDVLKAQRQQADLLDPDAALLILPVTPQSMVELERAEDPLFEKLVNT